LFQRGVHPGYIFVDHNKSLDNRNIIVDFLSLYRRILPEGFRSCTSVRFWALQLPRWMRPEGSPAQKRDQTRSCKGKQKTWKRPDPAWPN